MLFEQVEQIADTPSLTMQSGEIIGNHRDHIRIGKPSFKSQPTGSIILFGTRFVSINVFIPFRKPTVPSAFG
ncbi:MAG: hypothetical protein ABI947_26725 [Chloroflexota bacterium]